LNVGGLRYADEFVRHKLLDAFGDLYLAGAPLLGSFCGVRSGHSHTRRLLSALFADGEAWCYTTVSRSTHRGELEWQDGLQLAGD
jgi:UDP-3-O-[3-hydroxymyristoyl] N-acetylglucosamine deacetylase